MQRTDHNREFRIRHNDDDHKKNKSDHIKLHFTAIHFLFLSFLFSFSFWYVYGSDQKAVTYKRIYDIKMMQNIIFVRTVHIWLNNVNRRAGHVSVNICFFFYEIWWFLITKISLMHDYLLKTEYVDVLRYLSVQVIKCIGVM